MPLASAPYSSPNCVYLSSQLYKSGMFSHASSLENKPSRLEMFCKFIMGVAFYSLFLNFEVD